MGTNFNHKNLSLLKVIVIAIIPFSTYAQCPNLITSLSEDLYICEGECAGVQASAFELSGLDDWNGWETWSMALSGEAISNASPFLDVVNISGVDGKIFYQICLEKVTYTNLGDLVVQLLAPNGDTILLSNKNGSIGDSYGGTGGAETCFTIDATTPISAGSGNFNGSFIPDEGSFNSIINSNLNGLWKLLITDPTPGGNGVVDDWYIQFREVDTIPVVNYAWSPTTNMTGASTLSPQVCPTSDATYYFTATDGSGCSETDSVIISVSPKPVLSATQTNESCEDANDGSIDLSITQGEPPYTINWSNGASTEDISNLSDGNYTVTVESNGGCSENLAININPGPTCSIPCPNLIISLSSDSIVCEDECIDLQASAFELSGLDDWSGWETWSMALSGEPISNASPFIDVIDISDVDGKIFYQICLEKVTYTNLGDLVVQLLAPNGDTILLSKKNGSAGDSYGGTGGAETCFTIDATTPISAGSGNFDGSFIPDEGSFNSIINSNYNGLWKLLITDQTSGGNGVVDDWYIQFREVDTIPIVNYAWSPTTNMTGASTLSPQVCPTSDATYYFTATDGSGCSETDSVKISVALKPILSATQTNESCEGANDGSIDLSITDGEPPYTINWSNAASTEDISNLPDGFYTVTVESNSGCSENLAININPGPTCSIPCPNLFISLSNDSIICEDECIELQASAFELSGLEDWNGWETWSMALSGEPVSNTSPFVDVINVSGVTGKIFYQICLEKVTYSNLGDLVVQLIVPNGDTILLSNKNGSSGDSYGGTGGAETCFTIDATTPIASGSGNFNGIFIPDEGSFNNILNSNYNGLWKLLITDPTPGGNGVVDDWYIQFREVDTMPIVNYAWSPTTNMTGATTLSPQVCPTSDATYYFTATDGSGCSETDSVKISVSQKPVLSAIISNESCEGENDGAIDLTITEGELPYTINWSNGDSTEDISNLPDGFYSISTMSFYGCNTVDTIMIEQGTLLPTSDFLPDPATGTAPLDVSFTYANSQIDSLLWNLSEGVFSNDYDLNYLFSDTGAYQILLTTYLNGCTSTSTYTVYVLANDDEAPKETKLIIPNIFTPNEDGINDFFKIQHENIKSIEGNIYNRWGEIIFYWTEINISWDGRTPAGIEAPDGTYFYTIKCIDNNGNVYDKQGNLTLVR